MSEEDILKIEIPPEPDETADSIPVIEEPPLVPERPSAQPAAAVRQAAGTAGKQVARGATAAGKQVARGARRLWRTDARRKVTRGLGRGVSAAAAKSSRLVQDKVVQAAEQQAREQAAAARTRLQETDWQTEVRSGTARALRWLSRRLGSLAARINRQKEPPADGTNG